MNLHVDDIDFWNGQVDREFGYFAPNSSQYRNAAKGDDISCMHREA